MPFYRTDAERIDSRLGRERAQARAHREACEHPDQLDALSAILAFGVTVRIVTSSIESGRYATPGDVIAVDDERVRFVGVSPGGVLWVARAHEDYRTMRERLLTLRARRTAGEAARC